MQRDNTPMKKILFKLTCLFLFTSCVQSTYTPEFLTDDTIRLEVGKKTIFTYKAQSCQYAYNSSRLEFRSHTDNMSDYFLLKLHERPEKEGDEVLADYLEWTEHNGMNKTRKNLELQVVKIDGDRFWLWNAKHRIKMTIILP